MEKETPSHSHVADNYSCQEKRIIPSRSTIYSRIERSKTAGLTAVHTQQTCPPQEVDQTPQSQTDLLPSPLTTPHTLVKNTLAHTPQHTYKQYKPTVSPFKTNPSPSIPQTPPPSHQSRQMVVKLTSSRPMTARTSQLIFTFLNGI